MLGDDYPNHTVCKIAYNLESVNLTLRGTVVSVRQNSWSTERVLAFLLLFRCVSYTTNALLLGRFGVDDATVVRWLIEIRSIRSRMIAIEV